MTLIILTSIVSESRIRESYPSRISERIHHAGSDSAIAMTEGRPVPCAGVPRKARIRVTPRCEYEGPGPAACTEYRIRVTPRREYGGDSAAIMMRRQPRRE